MMMLLLVVVAVLDLRLKKSIKFLTSHVIKFALMF